MKVWTRKNIEPQTGKLAVVTGTGGIGLEVSLALAAAGAEVIVAGRNEQKGKEAIDYIRRQYPAANVRFAVLDLASLKSVLSFAQKLKDDQRPLDILINNAAVMALPERKTSADGFELQFGTNHLGHFLLTTELIPLLRLAEAPVVTTVSSIAHRQGAIRLDDLNAERRYSPWGAYRQSKVANILFAFELDRRSKENGWNIKSNAAHPGFSRTNIIANGPGLDGPFSWFMTNILMPPFSHSSASGALPVLFAAVSPEAKGSTYWGPSGFQEMKGPVGAAKVEPQARDMQMARKLWDKSEELVRQKIGAKV